MSLRLMLTERLLKSGIEKNLYGLKEFDMYMEAERENKDRDFEIPEDKKCLYSGEKLTGGFDCLKMQQGKAASKKAVLYIYEGLILYPDASDIQMASDICKKTGKDLWLPYYPVRPDHTMDDMMDVIMETYEKMKVIYGAENIVILGFGLGATFGIVMQLLLKEHDPNTVMADKIIGCSPQVTVYDQEIMQQMVIADPKDIRRDVKYTDFLTGNDKIWGEDRYHMRELFTGLKGDYTGMPEMHLFYGGNEILSKTAYTFKESCDDGHVSCSIKIEKGMMHCYQSMIFCPEGKKGFEELILLIGRES